jgi:hypothetical protein
MKKLISLIILILVFASSAPAQKVTFTMSNVRIESSILLADIYASVAASQTWHAGMTNIRIYYYVNNTPGGLSAMPESPVTNANVNLSGNSNYYTMTSTSIMNDTCISLNIQLLLGKTGYALAGGNSYFLGTLKFNMIAPPDSCAVLKFLSNSTVFDGVNQLSYSSGWTSIDPPPCPYIGISTRSNIGVPKSYKLSQNYPNPFNPTTTIEYSIPKSGLVTLKVFDMLGRQVAVLVNNYKTVGNYRIDFNASELSSGIYFYKMETNGFVAIKKFALIK